MYILNRQGIYFSFQWQKSIRSKQIPYSYQSAFCCLQLEIKLPWFISARVPAFPAALKGGDFARWGYSWPRRAEIPLKHVVWWVVVRVLLCTSPSHVCRTAAAFWEFQLLWLCRECREVGGVELGTWWLLVISERCQRRHCWGSLLKPLRLYLGINPSGLQRSEISPAVPCSPAVNLLSLFCQVIVISFSNPLRDATPR